MKKYFFAVMSVVVLMLLAGATIGWFVLLSTLVLGAVVISILKTKLSK